MTNLFDFTGRRVFVTGSTLGIGRAAAEASRLLAPPWPSTAGREESVDRAIWDMGGGPRLVAAHGDLSGLRRAPSAR